MIKEFKVGDRVKVIASPYGLNDPRSVGRFNLREEYLAKVYVIKYKSPSRPIYKLSNLDGSNSYRDYWYDPSWLKLDNPIWLPLKDK